MAVKILRLQKMRRPPPGNEFDPRGRYNLIADSGMLRPFMNKRDVLAETTFGARIADDEAETLNTYFVETEQWRKVYSGQVDIVYGPKGSGKSALYALLRKNREALSANGILLAAGENVRGTPVFEALVADPPASEEQFRGLWKLYFLSLIGTLFRIAKLSGDSFKALDTKLEQAGLVSSEWSLKRSFRSALRLHAKD